MHHCLLFGVISKNLFRFRWLFNYMNAGWLRPWFDPPRLGL
jgi:hypothetical protein